MANSIARFIAIAVLLSLMTGCGFIDYYFLPPPEDTAQELYEAGAEAMQEKNYAEAADYFTRLKDRYPFSPYTPQAEMNLGDALFLDESYAEAAEAYRDFEMLHPSNEAMPYILFQIGVSDYKTFSSIDRPADTILEALEYFHRLKEVYPDSEYAAQADDFILKCRKFQAEHELYVADFYYKRDHYYSAWKRYSFVMENFPELPEIQQYAESRAKMAYLRHQEAGSADYLRETQGSWKDWFDWL